LQQLNRSGLHNHGSGKHHAMSKLRKQGNGVRAKIMPWVRRA
jgi:hypothetical protein